MKVRGEEFEITCWVSMKLRGKENGSVHSLLNMEVCGE